MKFDMEIGREPIAEVGENFLSFTIDLSQIVGKDWWEPAPKKRLALTGKHAVGPFDFQRERLLRLSKLLAPAYLRISGTKCDNLTYFEDLSMERWDEINKFAKECGFEIIFGLSAGPGTRDGKKNWTNGNARKIVEHTFKKGYPVSVWELGNEINAFALRGRKWRIGGKRYATDFQRANRLIKSFSKDYRLAGPSSAVWPVIGEAFPVSRSFLKNRKCEVDIISWHYYPQQSKRCALTTRRAKPSTMLRPKNLDEINKWAEKIESYRDAFSPESEIWLTETGNAQGGGQPGISDTFVSSLWWLDQLGQLSKRGHRIVVRQTLSGSDYGLIDDRTLIPNPDYWASLLWKKLMGKSAYGVQSPDPRLRVYAHGYEADERSMIVLAINIHRKKEFKIAFGSDIGEIYEVTCKDLLGKKVFLNGKLLDAKKDISPQIAPLLTQQESFRLQPCSFAFLKITK